MLRLQVFLPVSALQSRGRSLPPLHRRAYVQAQIRQRLPLAPAVIEATGDLSSRVQDTLMRARWGQPDKWQDPPEEEKWEAIRAPSSTAFFDCHLERQFRWYQGIYAMY